MAAMMSAMPCVAGAPAARASRALRAGAAPARAGAKAPKAAGRAQLSVVAAASRDAEPGLMARMGTGLAALTLAATLQTAQVSAAVASELDVLTTPTPTTGFVLDDARILSKSAAAELNSLAASIEKDTGYRVVVVTLRKLQFETDAFAFADKVIERWYPTAADGNKKAVLVLVKGSKEGALVAGPELNKKLGSALVDSITGENIPILCEQEKFGEALSSSLRRVSAKLAGGADPGPPKVEAVKTGSNFKTKEETGSKSGKYALVIGGLLVISFVVPMVQYFGYVGKRSDD